MDTDAEFEEKEAGDGGKAPLWLVLCHTDGSHVADVKLTSPTEIRGDRARLNGALAHVAAILGDWPANPGTTNGDSSAAPATRGATLN